MYNSKRANHEQDTHTMPQQRRKKKALFSPIELMELKFNKFQ